MASIDIEGPVFYGQEDEEVFFQCIYALPGYSKVTGVGTRLTLNFDGEISRVTKERIEVLCQRWETKSYD